jgi:hypothetical protein
MANRPSSTAEIEDMKMREKAERKHRQSDLSARPFKLHANEISLLALSGTYLKCKHDNCKSGIDLHPP